MAQSPFGLNNQIISANNLMAIASLIHKQGIP
jgi:hypothetical protein